MSDTPTADPIPLAVFLFGSATPSGGRLVPEGEEQAVNGYVVFTYASERQYVPVVWWHDELTAGSPAPY